MATPAEQLQLAYPALRCSERLSKHTSLAIGGPADFYADVSTISDLIILKERSRELSVPVFFLGAGSNLLVSDKGIRGLVIHLQGDFKKIHFDGEIVRAGSGVMMPALAKQSAEKGLSGLEPMIGVPGTIGGGLVMNAGTREGWLGNVVQTVDLLNSNAVVETWTPEKIAFAYRHSALENQWVLGTVLRLKAEDRRTIITRIETLLQYRARTQPLGTNNCGSVFKNPEGDYAARLVEKAGLKGVKRGSAQISERHSNFIINTGHATAADVRALMNLMQTQVFEKFQIQLEPEIKLVGDWT